ncbi:uncharacterized protein MELLADRAFT_77437 [Melampsora larici-populina 98AG31]|uniref:Uncharacterized protein n=1 Tax=Melampsora larici-populina (strain 98AG31 / pathotype 3-4-7) TaxID=747676 RepID=F4RHQ2_MELLP|nr:uncharacterized protein MELLADRAFT_77437 [Melampsora larici-populina 98AG31]EGG07863.1 hypothetical protein MELLADRAFT_77437 [Melampsora larici-populina 98AG31]
MLRSQLRDKGDKGNDRLDQMARLTRGVWSLAFGRKGVAKEVGNELVMEKENGSQDGDQDGVLGSVEAYVELIMKTEAKDQKKWFKKKKQREECILKEEEEMKICTVDRLACLTIKWLTIRRMHLLKTVLPHQPWYSSSSSSSSFEKEEMIERVEEMKSLMIGLELELNGELNGLSTKQSDESISNGESKEYDLGMALKDCGVSVEIIEGFL